MEVPAEWNPVVLQGDARQGQAVLADPETTRLEMTWLPWRRRRPPDLRRTTQQQLKEVAGGKPFARDRLPLSDAFIDASILVSDEPPEARLILSSMPSRRVLILRVALSGLAEAESTMHRLAQGLQDASDRAWVPWSVDGFTFELPNRFRVTGSSLATERAELDFAADRREHLRLKRMTFVGPAPTSEDICRLADETGGTAPGRLGWSPLPTCDHRGHEVTLREAERPGVRALLLRRPRWVGSAVWHCPEDNHVFEVRRWAPARDEDALNELVAHVHCHKPST